MNYMESYVSDEKLIKKKIGWYPRKPSEQKVIRQIVREAFLQGWNVKEIAGYFKWKIGAVYNKLNIKALKVKIKERLLETSINS